MKSLNSIARSLFQDKGLFPGNCLLCGLAAQGQLDICQYCVDTLPHNALCCPVCAEPMASSHVCGQCLKEPPHFRYCLAPLLYSSPTSDLLLRFKNQADLACGQVLLQALLATINQHYANSTLPNAIIPVPLHWRKCWQRGFNQSRWLARQIAAELQLSVLSNAVIRNRPTTSQQSLSRKQRRQNLRNCFTVKEPFHKLNLAIVDDVMTTGSTANELAKSLLAAGACQVDVWCLARTPVAK